MDKLISANIKRQEQAREVRQYSITDFHQSLADAEIYRAFILYENGQFQLSHPKELQSLQAFCELSQDFDCHEGIFIGREPGLDAVFWAFVHDTRRGLSQGGLRFTAYQSLADVLVDGLRLSQGMTRKNALAGLSWGGGKGIMTLPAAYTHPSQFKPGPERQRYFEAYGRFVASLGGIYYTAEDVGTNTPDMQAIQSQNRFTTCIPASHGGSGNPSPFTARGVLRAMQAAWLSITGSDSLQGVKVAVQGTGNVGSPLIRYLDDLGAEIYVTDINEAALAELKAERPRLNLVQPPDAIFDLDVDVFAPCAIGAQVNLDTIPRLKVKLVCGAANNILREPEADAERLRERGIGFVPDFVCNRMGIVNCADEWQGYLAEDVRLAAERVFPDTLRVFKYARNRYSTTTQAAIDLADMAASELHPMLGHRGRRLIDHLQQSGWHQYDPAQPKTESLIATEPAFVPVLDEPALKVRWDRESFFQAKDSYALAATPMTTAASPDLGSTLSAVLLDIKAHALQQFRGLQPRRVLGAEHGGLALQIAVEQNQPYEREELGRPEFLSLCRDYYHAHDAQLRNQLHDLGVGFDPPTWISPMSGSTNKSIEQAYDFLQRADLLYTLEAIAFHCPRCESIRVASDVQNQHSRQQIAYSLGYHCDNGVSLSLKVLYPEYALSAVGVAIHPESEQAYLAGQLVTDPLQQRLLPVVLSRFAEQEPELICPLALKRHEKIAQEHLLNTRIQLFDSKGKICVSGYEGLSQEAARQQVLERFGEQQQSFQGSWTVEESYCGRCESRLVPRFDEQIFVKIDSVLPELRRLIESDQLTFSNPLWKQKVLEILADLNLWCISRQYWWGNPLPGRPGEVLSTWFTLAIWSLIGAGWPQNPRPAAIDEVFVDAELLYRWIIPSQLASLIITGQPIYRHVHVHGTLHVMERSLKEREAVAENAPDEERFLFHMVRRPMRYRLGNVIEPVTLIRRFGADALRLGYALSLDSHAPDVVLLSEDRLRQARRALGRLTSKVTGLFNLVRAPLQSGEPQILDHWMLYESRHLLAEMEQAYLNNDFAAVAKRLVEQAESLVAYINTAIERREQAHFGAARSTLVSLLLTFKQAFGPLCPFVFEKLLTWSQLRLQSSETLADAEHAYCRLLAEALTEPESMEPLEAVFQEQRSELQRYFGKDWVL